jgi:hypothetical protein
MELLLLRAEDTAQLANEMQLRMLDFTQRQNEQAKINEEILSEVLQIADRLFPALDNTGQKNLSEILRLIEVIIGERLLNFRESLQMLEWTSAMNEKYGSQYQQLIERYGYERN